MRSTDYSARIVSLVFIALAASGTYGQCSNDAGVGDTAEAEACALDETVDTTNGGCDSSPPVFTDVALDGGLPRTYCGIASTYTVGGAERRDTDWYLISQAELTAADTDSNGTVRIQSAVTGEAGLDLLTVVIGVDNLVDCNSTNLNAFGCWDSSGGGGQTIAQAVVTISQHPDGVVAFVAPGLCTGAGITSGFECGTGLNDYVVAISADASFEDGTFIACSDPASDPSLGPCNEANPGVGGCEDPKCCKIVCDTFNLLCCLDSPLGWIQQCADAAVDLGCAPELGGPICIATGNDPFADNYLSVCADPYGAWSSDTFGGAGPGDVNWGDDYNPAGPELLAQATFTNGFFLFDAANVQRELLANIIEWQQVFPPDASLFRSIVGGGSLEFDDSGDGISDRLESTFTVTGAGKDLTFDLTQTVAEVIPPTGTPVAVLTQTYQISNNSGAPVNFDLLRHLDLDLVWAGSTLDDDSVGTGTNGNGDLDFYAFLGEQGLPETYVTVSASDGTVYYGAKGGVDPDGAGAGPAMGAGTDLQQWDAYGVPLGWANYIAGVGYDTDGESGPAAGGDGSIGLSIPVSIVGNGQATVIVHTTYGADSPLGEPTGNSSCLPDLDLDGTVTTLDFIDLLGQWGQAGVPADINVDGTVDTYDLVLLLLCWGNCPCATPGTEEVFDELLILDVTDAGADALGLIVTHVYATGADVLPGDSLATGGNATITLVGGTFFQATFGTDLPPNSGFCGPFPETCYDTFVTNQLLADDLLGEIFAMPDFLMTTNMITGTWMTVPDSTLNQAVAIPTSSQFGVLIAQVTIDVGLGPSSVGYTGDMELFTGFNAGGSAQGSDAAMAFLFSGACCLTGGTCVADLTIIDCEDMGGVYQGDETTCTPNPCEPPTGACCLSDGNCVEVDSVDCGNQGGTYNGDGSTCSPNPCPTGSCCLSDGNCTPDISQRDCENQGGTYNGDGSTCSPNPCPTGSCCLPDGNCTPDISMRDCETQSGVYGGDGSSCTPNPCPTGACCLENLTCLADISRRDCENQSGEYQGDGTICTPNSFDITGDDVVGINDFLLLLQAWGPNPGHPADYNGDNDVGINDFLTLLANWGPCPI